MVPISLEREFLILLNTEVLHYQVVDHVLFNNI